MRRSSYAVTFGGALPVFSKAFISNSRANDALEFRQLFLLQYGSLTWSGMIIDADTQITYSRLDVAWLPGFSGFYKDFISTLALGPSIDFMVAHGSMNAYGLEKPIEIPFGLLPSVILKLRAEYTLSHTYSVGAMIKRLPGVGKLGYPVWETGRGRL